MQNLSFATPGFCHKLTLHGLSLQILILCTSLAAAAPERSPFALVVLPDTQVYAESHPDIFTAQTQWIKDNKERLNIVFVLHEGDITNNNTDREWQNANTSMSLLDDVVPYTLCPGNHDVPNHGRAPANCRNTAKFNHIFPTTRFDNESWWGGSDPKDPDSRYVFFNADGMEFMIISTEFGPSDAMLDWANQIVSQYPQKHVIFLTHAYMYHDDTRIGLGDYASPRGWEPGNDNDGEDMWEKFVKRHKNIFLVLSGHIPNDDMLGRLTSTGVHGNQVHQILANYQSLENGGNGWLRIMKFIPDESKIEVSTYSPWLNQYKTDEQNRFDLAF